MKNVTLLFAVAILICYLSKCDGEPRWREGESVHRHDENNRSEVFDRRLRRQRERQERRNRKESIHQMRKQERVSTHTDDDWLVRNLTEVWQELKELKEQVNLYHPKPTAASDSPLDPSYGPIQNATMNAEVCSNNEESCKSNPTSDILCNGNGQCLCGQCQCEAPFFGHHCECDDFYGAGEEACQMNANSEVCSGRGDCVCGTCYCHELWMGQYCECSDQNCERMNGVLCSGPEHGRCICGSCECSPGYTGNACECPTSTDTCVNPYTGDICSRNGACECGICRCFEHEHGRFAGRYCEDSPTSKSRCVDLRDCALCQHSTLNDLVERCIHWNNHTCPLNTVSVQSKGWEMTSCVFFEDLTDGRPCRFGYYYKLQYSGEISIYVPEEQNCRPY